MRRTRWGWSWLVGVVLLVAGVAAVLTISRPGGFGATVGDEPFYVEEFRVAEPFSPQPESVLAGSPLQMRLETISAVTEPFDEVEAAVEEQPVDLAGNRQELILQCVTVLKEMAFCSGDDHFLEIIGSAQNLRESEERQAFMSGVQRWFEPGGTRRDCGELMEGNDRHREDQVRMMWHRTSEATAGLCGEFGETLVAERAFQWLGALWEQ